MKLDLVIAPSVKEDLINLIHDRYDILKVINDGESTNKEMAQYCMDQCWFVSFSSDDYSKLLGVVMLEWIGDREVSIHLVTFNRVDIRKGWGKLKELIGDYVDAIHAYVPAHRQDVLRIAKKLDFKFKRREGIYHGQYR
jgi:hypothetical protein